MTLAGILSAIGSQTGKGAAVNGGGFLLVAALVGFTGYQMVMHDVWTPLDFASAGAIILGATAGGNYLHTRGEKPAADGGG